MGDLEAMILAKQNKAATGFLSYMEQKYCKGDQEDMPDESAFEAIAPGSKKRAQKAGPKQSGAKKRAKTTKWTESAQELTHLDFNTDN